MASNAACIRASSRLQEEVPGMTPASQDVQIRTAGVPLPDINRDVGFSGKTDTKGR